VLSAAWVMSITLILQQPAPPAAPPQWPDQRPFTGFIGNLGRDLRSLPNLRNAEILGVGLAATSLAHSADRELDSWIREAGPSLSYTPIGNLIGNEWLQGGAAIATYAIGVVQHSPEVSHIGGDLIRAQILNGILTTSLKAAAHRTRPSGGSWSFPSGHSSATFASVTVLAEHYGWKVGVPAYAVAGFIGWTRVRDGQHWLSDVVFGSTLGIIVGHAVTLGHRHPAWSVVPVASPNGGGVYVVKRN
jgi:membrane-associated phospholipid phosphatase